MKYQFCIRFDNIDSNSAASKAVLDCNRIFSENGYHDYTFTVGDNSNKILYYFSLLKQLISFFLNVKSNSVVGIQYPLLSINAVFKHFITLANLKKVTFFCIIHDLESLRTGGKDAARIAEEIKNLNFYDTLIVHNAHMLKWLKDAGVIRPMISLELFDYLSDNFSITTPLSADEPIVYAGNLIKSKFVYALPKILGRAFNLFGPNYDNGAINNDKNVRWMGEFSPDEIPKKLQGSYGLIWDGDHVEFCDEILGNYLKFNNPHKCSLYIAAGLPIIAPKSSAIGKFIERHNIGILVDSLKDLNNLQENAEVYVLMRQNVLKFRQSVITGEFFKEAISKAERIIGYDR